MAVVDWINRIAETFQFHLRGFTDAIRVAEVSVPASRAHAKEKVDVFREL